VNCEICGKNPARIRYTEVHQGETHKRRICEECARSLGFDVAAGSAPEQGAAEPPLVEYPPPKKKSVLILGVVGEGAAQEASSRRPDPASLRCPGCGITAAELRNQSLLGCPRCYETFGSLLDDLLRKVHGATTHRGRLPGGRVAEALDADALRAKLEEAIAGEDFEEAARLRDRLRRAGGIPPDAPEEEHP